MHGQIECERCHFLTEDGRSYAEVREVAAGLAAEGGGRVAAPAGTPQVSRPDEVLAATAPAGAPLDLKFRAAGMDCASCHPDPHLVRNGTLDCSSCHGFDAWVNPPRNGYHEGAGFSLTGAHTVVACSMCHTGSASMTGRGERCGTCHAQDDVHAGSLRSDCGRCHEQLGWLPTTFNHVDTGYVLEGLHRTLDCRQCHQAGNFFIGRECHNCHLDDYRNNPWHSADRTFNESVNDDVFWISGGALNPLNDAPESFRCDQCHNQFSFSLGANQEPAGR